MENGTGFTAWAIARAEAIVADQGLKLIEAANGEASHIRERQIVRLTVAIIEALVDARNFAPSQQQTSKSH